MVAPRRRPYLWSMQATLEAAPRALASSSAAPAAPRPSPALAALVLALFVPFSLWVLYVDGVTGLVNVIRHEPWGAQLLVDLCISATIASVYVARDARKRGLTAWPFLVGTLLAGSIGLLSYFVYRGLRGRAAA
jgi:hypothetical protein